jgi:hypothetical protein
MPRCLAKPQAGTASARRFAVPKPPEVLDAEWLRNVCFESGADDVGFVSVDSADIAAQRPEILAAFPATKALISFFCRMNRENIRTPSRSIANVEFHHTGEEINEVASFRAARCRRSCPEWSTDRLSDGGRPLGRRQDVGRIP